MDMFVFAIKRDGDSVFNKYNVEVTEKRYTFTNDYMWTGSYINKNDFINGVAQRGDGYFVYLASLDKALLEKKIKEYLESEVEQHKNIIKKLNKKLEAMSKKTIALYDEESDVFICDNCGEELSKEDVEVFSRCPDCKYKITSVVDDPSML